jgi:hypothetical protein
MRRLLVLGIVAAAAGGGAVAALIADHGSDAQTHNLPSVQMNTTTNADGSVVVCTDSTPSGEPRGLVIGKPTVLSAQYCIVSRVGE